MEINEEYTNIAYGLLSTHKELEAIGTYGVQIAFLSSNKEKKGKGKIIYADCIKVSDRYKWTCPYDFMITVYEPNVAGFTDDQIETLLWHEMLHVGTEDTKNGPRYFIRPHDIEDFKDIIYSKGIDWNERQKGNTDQSGADREDK